MSADHTAVGAVARWLRLTEGQLYSSVIILAVAVLLTLGLGNVHGVASSTLAETPLALAPVVEMPPIAVPTPALAPLPSPRSLPPFDTGAEPFPQPAPAPAPSAVTTGEPWPSQPPSTQPTPSSSPTACTAQPIDDEARAAILAADAAAGGGLPDEQLLAALVLVTGCTAPEGSPSPSATPCTTPVLCDRIPKP